MNEAPKELTGLELLKHAAELYEALERGEKIELWHRGAQQWFEVLSLHDMTGDFWLYRVAPKKIVRYWNYYSSGGAASHDTRAAADEAAGPHRIACLRIEFHEGQYDE